MTQHYTSVHTITPAILLLNMFIVYVFGLIAFILINLMKMRNGKW